MRGYVLVLLVILVAGFFIIQYHTVNSVSVSFWEHTYNPATGNMERTVTMERGLLGCFVYVEEIMIGHYGLFPVTLDDAKISLYIGDTFIQSLDLGTIMVDQFGRGYKGTFLFSYVGNERSEVDRIYSLRFREFSVTLVLTGKAHCLMYSQAIRASRTVSFGSED